MIGLLNIQIKPTIGNKDINLKKVEHFIKKNKDKKLDLVILPEFFSTGIDNKSFLNEAENLNGSKTISKICELAKQYNTNIIAGSFVEKEDDKLYNTTFVIDRKGLIVDKYRKIHLYNYLGGAEGDIITSGNKFVVAELDIGKVGLCIGFDIRYPQQIKKLVQMGAQIIVIPAAWVVPNEIYNQKMSKLYAQNMWECINRTRAYDNLVYIVTCNQTGKVNEEISAIGTSMIISPTTQVIANAKDEQTSTFAEIDLELVKYYKSIYPITTIE